MASAIIVAAGSSRRMGFDKLMAPLAGVPVLQHSAHAFASSPLIHELILVCPEERFGQLDFSDCDCTVKRVDGGSDRHHSVAQGLEVLDSDSEYIAVHDGARPLITHHQIAAVLLAAREHGAATSARRVTETLKRADSQQFVCGAVDREHLWLMETPQIFRRDLLLSAYRAVEQSGQLVTDEVSALEMISIPTYLVPNPSPNLKITFPEDIALAELLLAAHGASFPCKTTSTLS